MTRDYKCRINAVVGKKLNKNFHLEQVLLLHVDKNFEAKSTFPLAQEEIKFGGLTASGATRYKNGLAAQMGKNVVLLRRKIRKYRPLSPMVLSHKMKAF